MDRPANDAIERAKVREVVAIFYSEEALKAAAEALMVAGFDRADLDRLADLDEVGKRLGPLYVAHEELADVAQTPRRPVITDEDIATTFSVAIGSIASFAGLVTAFVVVASGGKTGAAVIDALLAAIVAGSISGLLVIRIFRPPRSRALGPVMAARGIVLWVDVRSPDHEEKARQILHQYGGQAIRVHEIEVEKHPEDIPLGSLRPDPWLGNERLGQP